MKPYKIFLYLIVILAIVLIIAKLFPNKGIEIGDGFLLKFHFSFFDKQNTEQIKYADINQIIEDNKSAYFDSEEKQNDTVITEPVQIKNKPDTLRVVASSLNKKIYAIEYPNGDTSILFPFFNKLKHSNRSRVRVLHYGDSQLEGDRITGYLRNKFQRQFGGSGPGLLPLIEGAAESASIRQRGSHNWVTHSLYYKQDTILPHRKFGILGRFYRFTDYCTDINSMDTIIHKAYVEYSRSEMAYRSVNKYNECRIFYGNCKRPITVKGFVNDKLIWFEDVDTTIATKIITWDFDSHPDKFKIEFEGTCSPDVYGVALDAHKGVSVDNLPFRGSSGTEFTKFDYNQYKQMGSFLNAGLIIVQFGVNVVPYEVKSYKFYQRSMTRQLRFLQKVFHAPVLVVGVSDMSYKVGNYYKSYTSVVKVKEAQRLAAKSAGCAYWDLYSAMGGANSMPSWVFAKPSLAQKDFTHFNRRGGHIVAQMLYNAIIQEYNKFKKELKTVNNK